MPKRTRTYRRRKSYRRYKRPYKNTKRSYRRRTSRRVKSQGSWKTKVAPVILKVKMFYHVINLFDSTNSEYYRMSGNSVYDPDAEIGGGQPVNYDDLVGLYDEYIVVGSKCKVTFTNQGIQPVRAYIHANNYYTPFNPLTTDPYAQMNTSVTVLGLSSGGHDQKTLSMYRSTKAMWGRNPQYDPNFSSSTSANPASRWYWHIGCYDQSPASVPLNVEGDICMTYYVVLRKRKAAEAYD